MTKEEFTNLVGEDPEDMFGPDWRNIAEEWLEEPKKWSRET